MADGHLNICKVCVKQRIRAYRVIEGEKVREQDRIKYQKRRAAGRIKPRTTDPHKKKATTAVNNSIRDGNLVRPDTCELCHQAISRIEAHHDDYDRPLQVRWLCAICHRRLHSKYHAVN
tara:strand:+ start:106 stop:462 length:357 start_codon:yes stop_codon:yes gene_type:complete